MKRITLFLTLFIFCFMLSSSMKAENVYQLCVLSDSSQISLLTNSPYNEAAYTLFGHTAIRVKDVPNNIDFVFNYGIFDFSAPNFIFRFVKGETDYMLAGMDYRYYLQEYEARKVKITEQVLNLSKQERQAILGALFQNALPQNRVYRYSFLYDNCSTRPRDIVEKNIQGVINYTPTNKQQTYRDLIHECVHIQPWLQFGIDLVIGADADKVINDRQKDFLPLYLKNAYTGATISDANAKQRQLVVSEHLILNPEIQTNRSETTNFNEPLLVGIALLVLTLIISVVSYKKQWHTLHKVYDTLLFTMAGLAGLLVFFLMFFSEHPATGNNWNIVWLNPLEFIIALLFFVKYCSKFLYYYHFINFVILTLFLLVWYLIPQQLEIAFIPYIMSILLRSGMNVLQYKKNMKRAISGLSETK